MLSVGIFQRATGCPEIEKEPLSTNWTHNLRFCSETLDLAMLCLVRLRHSNWILILVRIVLKLDGKWAKLNISNPEMLYSRMNHATCDSWDQRGIFIFGG